MNNVAPERSWGLSVESALDVLKNDIMRSTTGDEIQSFLLRFESLFSKEKLFASEQTNITEFFSKGWYTYRVHEHCPIFKTPHRSCPSASKILPPLWLWMCNFKWTTPLQIITSQLKENIIQGWLICYQVLSSGSLSFSVSIHNLVWLSFNFFAFIWSLTICFFVASYSCVCSCAKIQMSFIYNYLQF